MNDPSKPDDRPVLSTSAGTLVPAWTPEDQSQWKPEPTGTAP